MASASPWPAKLPRQRFNVVLHGRNPSKLEGVCSGLKERSPNTEIRITVADAASPDWQTAVSNVVKVVQDLDLMILINNVGGSGALVKALNQDLFGDHER